MSDPLTEEETKSAMGSRFRLRWAGDHAEIYMDRDRPFYEAGLEEMITLLRELAEGLTDPRVTLSQGYENETNLSVEGWRVPTDKEIDRVRTSISARKVQQREQDKKTLEDLRKRSPELFEGLRTHRERTDGR